MLPTWRAWKGPFLRMARREEMLKRNAINHFRKRRKKWCWEVWMDYLVRLRAYKKYVHVPHCTPLPISTELCPPNCVRRTDRLH